MSRTSVSQHRLCEVVKKNKNLSKNSEFNPFWSGESTLPLILDSMGVFTGMFHLEELLSEKKRYPSYPLPFLAQIWLVFQSYVTLAY